MTFKKWNSYLGWLVFLIATTVYFLTIEDTVSLWDCGEYITAAYKLEVGHPPGAPFFMVLGRLFSFFADPENVAVWMNRLSGLSSSLTILFMFWSISMLAQKIILKRAKELSTGDKIAILGAAMVGSLAYMFTDSFWFSAVEGEVYAMASLFTAAIFWAILKWDEEMQMRQSNTLSMGIEPDRWLLLIMFLLGLAIGVHLLGILVVPAIGYVIYFRYKKEVSLKSMILVGLLSVVVLGFIQEGVIPGTVAIASSFEVTFKNSFGLPFYSGTIFFFGLIVFGSVYLIRYARKKNHTILYNATMGLVLLLIGYGSFAVIVIRSNANTPLDENDPENLVTLHAYLKREQYGSAPVFFGPQWNSEANDRTEFKDRSAFYLRRFVVVKGDSDVKAYKAEKDALAYAKENGGDVVEKYYMSNSRDRENQVPTYAQSVFFPRMYWSAGDYKTEKYKEWAGYDPNEDKGTEIGSDGKRLPSFGENLTYFTQYQVNWMYWRYFMWNFSGRQNDIQGHGDHIRGNWKSGFGFIDNDRLGNQDEFSPYFTSENKSNNSFYFLPFMLGLIGLIFHFYRAPKDAFVVSLVFLFTGLAIVVYLNQKPFEPRERDYAYAGSFYFFALWIGIGVLALYESFKNFGKAEWKKIAILAGIGLVFNAILDSSSEASMPSTLSWIMIVLIGGGALGLMALLKKVVKEDKQGAIVATLLGLAVPIILGVQGWDDHDRSGRTMARDLAVNYLNSIEENGILYTNGDNDTFPLWYAQEVEGVRTDVRVCNLSLMQTDWYTEQMKMKSYESDPLPIRFREDQILVSAGNTDQILFYSLLDLFYMNASPRITKDIIRMRIKENPAAAVNAVNSFNSKAMSLVSSFTADGQAYTRLELLRRALTTNSVTDLADNVFAKMTAGVEILQGLGNGTIKTANQEQAQAFQRALVDLETGWNYTDLAEAMTFVANDANLVNFDRTRKVRIFPSKGFSFDVNKENAIASGVVKKSEKMLDEIRFEFDDRYLSREQLMMLDIMVNNDWKRGISYSSPGSSAVSIALYRRRYLKQSGLSFELSPSIDQTAPLDQDRMYENLMTTYNYNGLDQENVLTDYYARRHTDQYRSHFEALARDYLRIAQEAEDVSSDEGKRYIDMLRNGGQVAEAERRENLLKNQEALIKESREKAIALIMRSLKVMPIETVLDHSEASQSRGAGYMFERTEYPVFADGNLHNYVEVLFEAGALKEANAFGVKLANNLESIVNHYLQSNAAVVFSEGNTKDMYAALDNYFRIAIAASNSSTGDPEGALSERTRQTIDNWYKIAIPKSVEALKQLAINNGESVRSSRNAGKYTRQMFGLKNQTNAIATHFGLLKPQPSANDASLEQMMNGQ